MTRRVRGLVRVASSRHRVATASLVALVATAVVTLLATAHSSRAISGRADGRGANAPAERTALHDAWHVSVAGWVGAINADHDAVAAITGNTTVRLLAASDGASRWAVPVDGVENAPPALTAALVVAVVDGGVVALDRPTGRRRWQLTTDAPAAPVAAGGGLVVVGTWSGGLAALADDGSVRWQFRAAGAVEARPAIAEGSVVAAWHDGPQTVLRALDTGTGAVRWEASVEGAVSGPAVADGAVVVASDGAVRAFALDSGRPRWTTPAPGRVFAALAPAVVDGQVLTLDRLGVLGCLRLRDGRPRWWRDLGDAVLRGGPVVLDGVVYAATDGPGLHAVDTARGRLVDAPLIDGRAAGIVVTADQLVIGLRFTDPGRIDAWRAAPRAPDHGPAGDPSRAGAR
jgi:outer membrane protein assembly factor BamB